MSVQINSGISVLEMHRLTDNLSSLQCHCETTENSLTHCTHGQRERESELRQKWTWWRRNRKSKYGLLAARLWAIEAERVREVRPKTEKKRWTAEAGGRGGVEEKDEERRERERKRESGCCQGQQHNRERSSYTTSALFTPPPLWLDSISPSVYLPQVMSAVDPVRVNSAYWNHC